MTTTSFANATSIDFGIQPTGKSSYQEAYDNTLTFNRYIKNNDDPYYRIYSIDWMRFHRHVSSDNLKPLKKISLVAKVDRQTNGFALWDVVFNNADQFNVNACVFVADSEFDPIGDDGVVTKTNYSTIGLSSKKYKTTTFRSHLNKVNVGDHVGIGIFCVRSARTYVLMYKVDSPCYIKPANMVDRHDVPVSLPGFNCSLIYAIAFDSHGTGKFVPFLDEEMDVTKDTPFIQHIVQNVGDTTDAYPWKAHFTPTDLSPYQFEDIKNKFEEVSKEATLGRYEDIEPICRSIYKNMGVVETKRWDDLAREFLTESSKKGNTGKKRKLPTINYVLPVVDVYKFGELIIVSMVDSTLENEKNVISFNKSTMGHEEIVEKYLSFKDVSDLGYESVSEVSKFETEDGEEVLFRRLILNY